MNPYAIPPMIASLMSGLTGAFILKKKRPLLYTTGGMFCLSMAIWLGGDTCTYLSRTEAMALFWSRVKFLGVAFLPIFNFHFILNFLRLQKRRVLQLIYPIGVLFLALTPTNLIYAGVYHYFWGYYPKAGSLYSLYILFFFILWISGGVLLWRAAKEEKAGHQLIRYNQIRFLLGAFSIGLLGTVDFLPKYHVTIYPFAYLCVFVWLLMGPYAILKYRLLDITLATREVMIYTLSAIVVAGPLIAVAWVFFSPLVIGLAILTASLATPRLLLPLRQLFEPIVDHSLFRGRFDYLHELPRYEEHLKKTPRTANDLAEEIVLGLRQVLQAETCGLFLWDEMDKTFHLKAQAGLSDPTATIWIHLRREQPLIQRLVQAKDILLKEELSLQGTYPEYAALAEDFELTQAVVAIPMFMFGELLGVITLGPKANGTMYHQGDLTWLRHVGHWEEELFRIIVTVQRTTLFAPRIAHEMQGIFKWVPWTLRELFQTVTSRLTQKEQKAFLAVLDELDRHGELVRNFFEFTKMVQQGHEKREQATAINVRQPLEQACRRLRTLIERKGLSFRVQVPHKLPPMLGEEASFRDHVFTNLLTNAYKYTSQGHIEVTVEVKEGWVVISVSDTGCGIPASELERIWEPFHRVAPNDRVEGSGLGLAIVKETVELYGGKVAVESTEGKGSVFTVRFPVISGDEGISLGTNVPVSEERLKPSISRSPRTHLSRTPKETQAARVLVVDDNPKDLNGIATLLKGRGYEVLTASDGDEALEILNREPIDLMTLDLAMPKVKGDQVLKTMKADLRLKDIPVVIITGVTDWDKGPHSLRLRAQQAAKFTVPTLSKPSLARLSSGRHPKELADEVDRVLRKGMEPRGM
ncbi:MAG: response regulator [Elusimicrobia bacterium]|nr:response regulator [Elusimicrobiota bacterium]